MAVEIRRDIIRQRRARPSTGGKATEATPPTDTARAASPPAVRQSKRRAGAGIDDTEATLRRRAAGSRPSRNRPGSPSRGAARTRRRLSVVADSAAFSVPLVLTTSRSPADSQRGRSRKRACSIESVSTSDTSSRTSSRLRPRASGGSAASRSAGSVEVGHDAGCSHRRVLPAARRTARRARVRDSDRTANSRTGP